MSKTIFDNERTKATLFAGPARPEGGERRMVQINDYANGMYVQIRPDALAAIAAATAHALGPRPDQCIVAFCTTCNGWTMVCTPTSQNRVVWTRIASDAGDRISYVDADELDEIMSERGSCSGACDQKPAFVCSGCGQEVEGGVGCQLPADHKCPPGAMDGAKR